MNGKNIVSFKARSQNFIFNSENIFTSRNNKTNI